MYFFKSKNLKFECLVKKLKIKKYIYYSMRHRWGMFFSFVMIKRDELCLWYRLFRLVIQTLNLCLSIIPCQLLRSESTTCMLVNKTLVVIL